MDDCYGIMAVEELLAGILRAIRGAISGEVLLARSLLPSMQDDPAKFLGEVKATLPASIAGVVSDGQTSIRNAMVAACRRRASCQAAMLDDRAGATSILDGWAC